MKKLLILYKLKLNVKLICKNRIMDQDSYSVISNKFIDTGFKYKDSLKKLI